MITSLPNLKMRLPAEPIAAFCRRWKIARLDVFGSVLREDFHPDSDVDLLATYAPEAHWSLLDRMRMKFELESLLACQVDLLNRRALEKSASSPRSTAILAQARLLYAES